MSEGIDGTAGGVHRPAIPFAVVVQLADYDYSEVWGCFRDVKSALAAVRAEGLAPSQISLHAFTQPGDECDSDYDLKEHTETKNNGSVVWKGEGDRVLTKAEIAVLNSIRKAWRNAAINGPPDEVKVDRDACVELERLGWLQTRGGPRERASAWTLTLEGAKKLGEAKKR